jgi:C-terminal processing protease CtpA/Prc
MNKAILIALLCGASLAAAQSKRAEQQSTTAIVSNVAPTSAAELRREAFEKVWRTVKEKHFDPSFGGVDWDRVRERYAPRLSEIKTDRELYELLQQMLDELKQSHFSIIAPEAVIEDEGGGPSGGGVGVDLRIISGRAVVTRVEPDSAAAP